MLPEAPLRKVSHDERVAVGRMICEKILDTYKESALAVFISGSTAKSLDRPWSDLEMDAVVRDDVQVPIRYFVYKGLIVQLTYHQETPFLKEAREPGFDWPIGADQYRNRIVLFDRDSWLRKLEHAVAENENMDFTETIRYAALGMTESLSTVRNADFKDDMIDLRTRTFYMAWDTARVVFLLNRKYVLTSSWYWKQLFECAQQPKDLRMLIETLAGFVPSTRKELVESAERLWSETMSLVQVRGVSIETDQAIA